VWVDVSGQTVRPLPGDPLPGIGGGDFEEFRLGLNDFIVCAGYKQDVIKNFFANYHLYRSAATTFEVQSNGRVALLGKAQAEHVLLLRERFLPIESIVNGPYELPNMSVLLL